VVRLAGELFANGTGRTPTWKEKVMKHARILALAILTGATLGVTGCAVMRGQTDVGSYVDDRTITTSVKAKLIEDKRTGGMSINVDTLNGEVALSGFAKSAEEKAVAEQIARSTGGVRAVRNNLVIRP
jgi:osmotically-inducible protein OsmY